MLKYIIKDLKETLTYLPYGIMAGAVVGLLLNGLNARRERKGKDTFPMAGLMTFSLYLMIILVITFSPERMAAGSAWIWNCSLPGGRMRGTMRLSWKMYCCLFPMDLSVPGHSHGFGDFFVIPLQHL